MSGTGGSARQEAERLVATVIAMASQGYPRSGGWATLGDAVSGFVGQADHGRAGHVDAGRAPAGGWSTGTAECCVCPVCRVIAGLRDPDPQVAERLATGAGDFAAGVASLLRAFAPTANTTRDVPTTTDVPGARDADPGGAGRPAAASGESGPRTGDDPWASATAAGHDPTATVPRATRPAVKRPAAESAARPMPAGDVRNRDPWAAATAPAGPADARSDGSDPSAPATGGPGSGPVAG